MNRREFNAAALAFLSPLQRERVERAAHPKATRLDKIWLAPWLVMNTPDPWQEEALGHLVTSHDDVLMLCSRGSGKTKCFAAAAYVEAALGGFAMILSRSDRQALRVMRYVKGYHVEQQLGRLVRDTMHEMEFSNGGRVIALPCSGDTVVGEHGVTLLGLDEAARIKDEFYAVVTPMLAVSERVTGVKARLALMTTPFGKRGFFWEEWEGERAGNWKRHRYTWRQCPRITPQWVELERRRHGDLWVRQEYEVEFVSLVNSPFDVDAMMDLERGDYDTI